MEDRIKELFDYDPDSGRITWKAAIPHGKPVGSEAGVIKKEGYRRIAITVDGKRRSLYAHRVAWLLMTGSFPDALIDHVNGDKGDNRWANLRAATYAENGRNRGKQRNSSSGLKGVALHKPTGKWMAHIGKTYLGLFDCPAAASFAYQISADNLHGEFARVA